MNDNIRFEAARVELYKLFSEVKGFYIPEYQRPFTWTVEHAGRLFDTIENAIESSINEPYYAFLGAILVMDNIDELENNYPIVRDESPSSVYAVIDGQQRITSLILLMTEVYKKLLEMNKNLENFEINSEFKGKLQGAINKTVEALFVKNDWINKENKVAYLPKIINGYYNDEWKKQVEGIYRSPISKLLLGLSPSDKKAINLEISDEEYDSFDEDDENSFPDFLENDDKSIARATKRISEITDKYSERLNSFMSNYDILNKVLNKEELQKRFLERKLPEQLLSAVNDYNSPLREPVSKLLLLLIFHNYFLNNIIFAQISVSKEAFAFDIFDSLNSTGDPLTAFETFRPLVIKNTENYSKSSEKKYLTVFSEYLAKKKEDRLTLTKRFIISLALYENGAKDYEDISETLNRQRKYLRNTFEKNPDERTNFCHSFARLTYFYQDVWEKNLSQLDNGISEEAKVSLAVLRKTKHTLTIPILARYYSELILGKKQPDYTIFSSVIKGITVFSLFWRLINAGSTAGIDDVYKELIKSRISRNVGTLPSLSELLKILRNDYLRKFSKSSNAEFDEKTFIEKVSKAQYTNSKSNTWLKFFLLAALHDSIPDPNEVGLDIKGTPKCNTMLNIWGWESSDRLTLEHIAPQRPENINNWENKLLLPDYAHSIGNLTLLPKQQNSIAGNKDWKIKKEIYSILSSDDNNTRLSKILKLCEKYEIDLTKSSEKTIKNSDFWPCIKSISKVNKWTSAIVEKRADRLAGLGWETLSPWLGY